MRNKKLILTLVMSVLLIISQTACTKKTEEPISKENYALDTVCNITIYSMKNMSKNNAIKVIDGAYELSALYVYRLSKTIKTSDIYKINHSKGTYIECKQETVDMLKEGILFSKKSNGAFDITVGKLSDLWDFHKKHTKLPDDKSIKNSLNSIGYNKIEIKGNKVRLKDNNCEIDLGGIAKGYIADKMAEYLEEHGVNDAIINLGGNVYAIGHKDGKSKNFNIGIRKPFSESGEVIGTSKLSNGTIVTSGPYERYFTLNGKMYHHILDLKTGYPAESNLNSVTIIGPKGTSAKCDAIATTCYVLGIDKGSKYVNNLKDYTAVFLTKSGKIVKSNSKYEFQSSK